MVGPNTADHSRRASEGQAVASASFKPAHSAVARSTVTPSGIQQHESSPAGCATSAAAAADVSAASGSPFRRLRFLQLVGLTGFLAATASVLGKVACSFTPGEPFQQFSESFLHWLCPTLPVEQDVLLLQSDADCGSAQFDLKPQGFGAQFVQTGRAAVLLATYGPGCKLTSAEGVRGEISLGAVSCFFCVVLLLRVCLFGSMLACNALMLSFHVKSLLVAPSAGSSSVAVFASNFLCSVLLSGLLLGEYLSLRFLAGAACMLLGVALLAN